jgi:hypothetical protein
MIFTCAGRAAAVQRLVMEARVEQRVRRPCALAAGLAARGARADSNATGPRELGMALVKGTFEGRDARVEFLSIGKDESFALAALELAVWADGRDAALLAVWRGARSVKSRCQRQARLLKDKLLTYSSRAKRGRT